MNKIENSRGLGVIKFKDYYNTDCIVQESSLASVEAILIGIEKPNPLILSSKIMEGGKGWAKYPVANDVFIQTQMELTRDQVKDLIPILQNFVDTGRL